MKNAELEKFVEMIGGIKPAYLYLGCSYEQLYKMRKGERSVTPERAKRIIKKYPNLSFYNLLCPEGQAA